jgi:hypothetical protein
MTVQQMLQTHPHASSVEREALTRCIDECFSCAATCTSCADACLGEESVQELVRCIRLNLDCADVCEATGRIVTRQTAPDPSLVRTMAEACAAACGACAEECERHADHHEHCRICAEACRRCQQACIDVIAAVG